MLNVQEHLVESLDLHGGLTSKPHTAVWRSLLQIFHIQLYFFSSLLPKRYYICRLCQHQGFILPFCSSPSLSSSSVFLLPFLCPHELRSLELTLISKVVVQPSAESKFFFQALNICQQTLRGSACYRNKLCGKTQQCCPPLPTVLLGFDKLGLSFI